MENFESLTQQMPIFFRQHEDVAHGGKVDTLTEGGLYVYFSRRKAEEPLVLENSNLIIDYDLKAGSSFSQEAQIKLREAFSESCGSRKSFVVHRDGHTVSVIREGDTFLLLDSYNAHGTKDHDHFPLLQIIRKCNPEAKIYTLHDKIQNDYCNCRIFAVENIVEIEKYCRENECGLMQVIQESELIPPQFYTDGDEEKEKFYADNNIIPIGIPVPILHHVQSVTYLRTALNFLLDEEFNINSCLQKLEGHLRDKKNCVIKDISDKNVKSLLETHSKYQSLLSNEISQRSVVEKMSSLSKSQSSCNLM